MTTRPSGTPSMSHASPTRAATSSMMRAPAPFGRRTSAAPGDAFDLPADFARFDGLALVMHLFSASEAELHFDDAALEVGAQRDQRKTFLLQRAHEALDLAAVHQQFSVAIRFVLREKRSAFVRGDMHVHEPRLPAAQPHKAVAEAAAVGPDALDLGAGEHYTRLDPVDERILVERPPVRGDRLDAVIRHGVSPTVRFRSRGSR